MDHCFFSSGLFFIKNYSKYKFPIIPYFQCNIDKIGGNEMSTYELSLTSNYVADWDFPMAIRELIQNGVDQETLEPGNVFNIFYENGTLRFENLKSKLKINTLLLGRSSKTHDENTVGQFGEGYKISALVLNRLGKTFTVHNYGKNEI